MTCWQSDLSLKRGEERIIVEPPREHSRVSVGQGAR